MMEIKVEVLKENKQLKEVIKANEKDLLKFKGLVSTLQQLIKL